MNSNPKSFKIGKLRICKVQIGSTLTENVSSSYSCGFHTTLCFGLCRSSHVQVSGLIFGYAFLHISLSQLLYPLQKQELLSLKRFWLYHYIFNSELKFSLSRLHLPRAEVLDRKHAFLLFVNMFNFTLKWGLNSAPCAASSKHDLTLRNSCFLFQYRRFFPPSMVCLNSKQVS